MKNGIPFDVAFGVDDIDRAAWCIIFSEMADQIKFNFETMKFEERK